MDVIGHGEASPTRVFLAWLVHLYTASGAVLGFLALVAVFADDFKTAFIFLAIALAVDSSDGALARAIEVKRVVPWFDGTVLDNLVDYLNFVVVPVAIFMRPGILPAESAYLSLSVLLASAYGFSRTDAKGMIEHYFLGFPSYWNIMAFYFVVLGTPPALNLILVIVAVVMVFVPMRWIYPSRSSVMRLPTILLGMVWAVMGILMLAALPDSSPVLGTISLFYPVYYTALSVVYTLRY